VLVSFIMYAQFIFYVHPHLGVGYVSAYHVTCTIVRIGTDFFLVAKQH